MATISSVLQGFGGAPPHSSRLTLFGFRSFIGHEVLDGMAAEGCAVDRGVEKKDVRYCEVTNDDRDAAILRGMVKLMAIVCRVQWRKLFGVGMFLESASSWRDLPDLQVFKKLLSSVFVF